MDVRGQGVNHITVLTSLLREAADLSSIPATGQYIQDFLGMNTVSTRNADSTVFWQGGRRRGG